MAEQCTVCGRGRGWHDRQTASFLSRKAARKQPDRGGFHIAFAARNLARKAQAWLRIQSKFVIQELGRVEEGVAMDAAQSHEHCALKPRDDVEDANLVGMLEL